MGPPDVAGESPPSDSATQRRHQPFMSSTTHGGPTEQHNSNPATATPRGGDTMANPLLQDPRHASAPTAAALHSQRETLQCWNLSLVDANRHQ